MSRATSARRPSPVAGCTSRTPRRPRRAPAAETDRRARTRRSGRAGADGRADRAAHAEARRHAGGRVAPSSARRPRTSRPKRATCRSRSAVSARHDSTIQAACPSRPRSSRTAVERMRDVEVVDADQLAPPAVEEHELAEREQLEGAAEPRAAVAGPPWPRRGALPKSRERRSRADRSRRAGTLPITTAAELSRGHQEVSRNPNSRSARSSLRQFRVAPAPGRLEEHLMPKNDSSSRRAARADLLEHGAALADHDALLRLLLDEDRSPECTGAPARSAPSAPRPAPPVAYGTSWCVRWKIFSRITSAT